MCKIIVWKVTSDVINICTRRSWRCPEGETSPFGYHGSTEHIWIWTFGEHRRFHPEKVVLFNSRKRQRRTILQEVFPSGRQIHSSDDNGILKVTGIRVTAVSVWKKYIVIALYALETLNKGSTNYRLRIGCLFSQIWFYGNTTMFITIFNGFLATMMQLMMLQKLWLEKSKIFTIWLFRKMFKETCSRQRQHLSVK